MKKTTNARFNELAKRACMATIGSTNSNEIHAWLLHAKTSLTSHPVLNKLINLKQISMVIVGDYLQINMKNNGIKKAKNGDIITVCQYVANILNASVYANNSLDNWDIRDFSDLKTRGNVQYRYFTLVSPCINRLISQGYVKTHTDRQKRVLYK